MVSLRPLNMLLLLLLLAQASLIWCVLEALKRRRGPSLVLSNGSRPSRPQSTSYSALASLAIASATCDQLRWPVAATMKREWPMASSRTRSLHLKQDAPKNREILNTQCSDLELSQA